MTNNDGMPSPLDVYAAMAAANPELARQNQMATKQLSEEQQDPQKIMHQSIAAQQPAVISPGVPDQPVASGNLTDRIKELERRISNTKPVSKAPNRLGPELYKDDYGQTTWYIKNESGMHVSLGDKLGVVIQKGATVDLLALVDEEVLLKAQDFHARLRKPDGGLKRLTPEEYYNELQIIDEQTRKIQAMETARYLSTKEGNSVPQTIRPLIESQLNKLELYFDPNPEISGMGITPLSFIKWIMSEKLSVQEIDSLLGHPRVRANTDITSTLIRKRQE